MLESLTTALEQDAHLLTPTEELEIDNAVNELIQAVEGTDPTVIENAIKQLDKKSQEFAARRMDASIRQALSYHSVDEI